MYCLFLWPQQRFRLVQQCLKQQVSLYNMLTRSEGLRSTNPYANHSALRSALLQWFHLLRLLHNFYRFYALFLVEIACSFFRNITGSHNMDPFIFIRQDVVYMVSTHTAITDDNKLIALIFLYSSLHHPHCGWFFFDHNRFQISDLLGSILHQQT